MNLLPTGTQLGKLELLGVYQGLLLKRICLLSHISQMNALSYASEAKRAFIDFDKVMVGWKTHLMIS